MAFVVPLLFNDQEADAQNIAISDFTYGANVRPSYVMPTHGFYNGWNELDKPICYGGTADAQYGIVRSDSPALQGIGLAVHTFFAHELVGTPATLYAFQNIPLVNLSERMTFGYEWNLGLSTGWEVNDVAVSSPWNIHINVAALFTWKADKHWDIIFGPEYTHFSNGDTSFPNGGANTINFRVGARRHHSPSETLSSINIFRPDMIGKRFSERITYDVSLLGGWRADRILSSDDFYIYNEKFLLAGLQFNPLYRFNSYLSAGPSIDLLYDRSADLIVDESGCYSNPGFSSQSALGLSLRGEIKMPIFAVNVGAGYNFTFGGSDLKGLYASFALKAFLCDNMFLTVAYRLSSVNYAHNLMFGLGFRL
jgi:hypothetical protein